VDRSFEVASDFVSSPMQPAGLQPYRQGTLDGFCGLYAAINAMRVATRDADIEEVFWEEVFASLVLSANAHVGIAEIVLNGIAARPLFLVMREVLAEIEHRFGRRFRVTRPFRGLSTTSPTFIMEQLEWLASQPQAAIIIKLKHPYRHWTVVKEVGPEGLVLFDSIPTPPGRNMTQLASEPLPAVASRATMLIDRQLR
jgi:hypothetical protein